MVNEIALTNEMIAVLAILGFTIFLFVSEIVRVDVAAVLVMVLIGLSSLIPGYDGLVHSHDLFMGFSSNAVISIIAVMIMGAGLDKTGAMSSLASRILKIAGNTEKRIVFFISGTVAFISSFMQNIGAAALFMPVVARISRRTNISLSRLLMPMGYCAILGGTMTMIGSSPLILLNDLIISANEVLPPEHEKMKTFGLFAVTPVGIAMVASGILYFILFGRFVLPDVKSEVAEPGKTADYFEQLYHLKGDAFELRVSDDSPLVGKQVYELEQLAHAIPLIALRTGSDIRVAPARDIEITRGAEFVMIGHFAEIESFANEYKLMLKKNLETFAEILSASVAGISEIVIPPGSTIIGKSVDELRLRKTLGISILSVKRGDDVIRSDLRNLVFKAGDALVVHSKWSDLLPVSKDPRFLVVTDFPREETRPHKFIHAMVFFAIALSLILFTDTRLSIALMVGAVGMIVTGVLKVDEAYKAVGWQSVFLLASLIPLGVAVENTGTAAWIAQQTLHLLGDVPVWVLQVAIALLATVFTLVMSNVGATVLLVPLAINIALDVGANPAEFALIVALATSNSFFIPTHQVNALIMGPAGYRVAHFMRAGGLMTLIFLVVMIVMLNLIF
ncbi:MAG: SLC13 family permease [Gammaproteobacteria bacterium]|nr:SLC13 family permease [Gammaproteobacteria bacterium]